MAQAFLYRFFEKMRLARATDIAMCRAFPTCLDGKAWEWYTRLPAGSIENFEDLIQVFTKRYTGIRGPRVTCDVLLSMKQGAQESIRAFVVRFNDLAKKVENFSDIINIAALK